MALRRMLAILKGGPADEALLSRAFAVADAYGARLDALFVRRSARSGADFLGESFSVYGIERLLEDLEEAGSRAALAAKSAFEAAAADAPEPAVGQFIDFIGLPEEALRSHGALSDLVLVEKPGPNGDRACEDAAKLALLEAARPVLLLPCGEDAESPGGAFRRVMVAFDGSRESAHALIGALDVLAAAQDVDLVTIVEDGGPEDLVDVADRYLTLHGVHADRREEDRAGRGTGQALVETAQAVEADLLVMGGYGAGAWLDPMASGATRSALRQGPCAILMMH